MATSRDGRTTIVGPGSIPYFHPCARATIISTHQLTGSSSAIITMPQMLLVRSRSTEAPSYGPPMMPGGAWISDSATLMSTASRPSARTSIHWSRTKHDGAGRCSARSEPSGQTGSSFRPSRCCRSTHFEPPGCGTRRFVAASGGILGSVTRAVDGVHGRLLDDIDPLLHLASERGPCLRTRGPGRR
jgi:hypothetical protein